MMMRMDDEDDDMEDEDDWGDDECDEDDQCFYSACLCPVHNASHRSCLVIQVQKLIEGNEYIFRVSAINKEGTSKPLDSDVFIAKSPFGKRSIYSVQFSSNSTISRLFQPV